MLVGSFPLTSQPYGVASINFSLGADRTCNRIDKATSSIVATSNRDRGRKLLTITTCRSQASTAWSFLRISKASNSVGNRYTAPYTLRHRIEPGSLWSPLPGRRRSKTKSFRACTLIPLSAAHSIHAFARRRFCMGRRVLHAKSTLSQSTNASRRHSRPDSGPLVGRLDATVRFDCCDSSD